MLLGPVELYEGRRSRNVENAWQFSKVYPQHVDANGRVTGDYWRWAKDGWGDHWAHRYPMGKGAVPLFSLWEGQRLGYVEARKKIYVPLYAAAVRETEALRQLQTLAKRGPITLWDYDGYSDYTSLEEVLNNPSRKMGHAFVLAMLLEGLG